MTLEAVVSLGSIQYLVAQHTLEEGSEVPVLEVDGVVPSIDELRLSTAALDLVFVNIGVRGDPVAIGILIGVCLYISVCIGVFLQVVYIEHAVAVGIVSGKLTQPECSERLAFHDALSVVVGRDAADVGIALVDVFHTERRVREFVYTVLVVRQVDGGLPLEVTRLDGNGVQCEFNTAVGDVTDIGTHPAKRIDVRRHAIVPDQVRRLFIVVLNATVQSAAEEGEVDTDVEHGRLLPLQFGVGIVLCLDAIHGDRRTVGLHIFK